MHFAATFQQHGAASRPEYARQHQIRCMHAQLQIRCETTRIHQVKCLAAASAAAHAGHKQQAHQAVVIGSGIAGLVSAEVLSKYFRRVVVIEKDEKQPEWEQSAVDMVKVNTALELVDNAHHLLVTLGKSGNALVTPLKTCRFRKH